MKPKAVCVVSGGLDSTTMLYYVIDKGYEPIVLTFNYGQKHLKEIAYARRTCLKLGVKQYVLTLPPLIGSALTDDDTEIPKDDYSVETQKLTVVPNRNMVFLSIAATYAIAEGAQYIYYAAHKNDDAVYPDCTQKFVTKLNHALHEANYEYVTVIAPFISQYKYDIINIGEKLGVPFEETWSCYDPQLVFTALEDSKIGTVPANLKNARHVHCGVCGTCRERKQAFITAEVKDPTIYKS